MVLNFLKCVLDKLLDPLVFIFNLSFNTGKVPESLKIAKVIPIYKKGETTNPTNYRPISLLSIFDKIVEKLMHKRFHSFLQQHSILHQYQFGLRKNHSTIMALIELTDSFYLHIDNRDSIIGMYFDTVNHDILLCKLQKYGIRGIVLDWFRDYLHNRKQFVSVGD